MNKKILKKIAILVIIVVCITIVGYIGFWFGNEARISSIYSKKIMTTAEIAQFEKTYGWTPPYGFTERQLIEYMKASPGATSEELEEGAKRAQFEQSHFYSEEIGFSFDYPEDMFIMDGSLDENDNYRKLVIPKSFAEEGEQEAKNFTAVVITASENQALGTPLDWLKGPYSGADMSKGYSEIDMDGQKAISMNGDNWVTVNTPNNEYRITIATLPGRNPSWSLQNAMISIVESITFAK
jgi:hypothetical protein